MIEPILYDQARERIESDGLTADVQTKIALLLSGTKTGNAAYHSWVQWMARLDAAQQSAFTQYSRELEAISLLLRTTSWSINPALPLRGNQIISPLAMAWGQILLPPPGPALNPDAAFRGLALGHAQLARIRFAPVIPDAVDPLDPFVVALRRIEQENARMLQLQIRLLKSMPTETPLEERESRIAAYQDMVDGVFSQFLSWLAAN
ncbi:hypothetical protein F2Q65_04700 [Thiohalocapsa marina]|uniref:Uncharacterized protein n=2 Tax=Thiohalocapsa marina TaxID=424902 RepID=A0A5M8FP29_9GAMM|nr:hypothetical protein [Thiohalocapsa marina]KAA6186673.1 hypothetical protein F2Q65_04700 [Thiohalocapsa marina]